MQIRTIKGPPVLFSICMAAKKRETLAIMERFSFFIHDPVMFYRLLAGKFNSGVNFSEHDIRNANPKLVGPDFEKYFNAAKQLKDLADKYNKPMNEIACQ